MKDDTTDHTRSVLVIGGSGGIGGAIANEFAAAGWRVALHFHTHRDAAEKCAASLASPPLLCQADVRRLDEVEALIGEVVKAFGQLDAMIYAAGAASSRLLLRVSENEWTRVLDVNATGAFHCLRAAGSHMTARRRGSIVLVGSFAGLQGAIGQSAYAASKAALIGLVRSTAREWAEANVRVNLVLPGWQRTALSADSMPDDGAFDDHLLGAPPPLADVARMIRQFTELPAVSGQIWNLDSRLPP
jgi:3-oxoacyl-[acyl-carrier protein] reductase